mgnify:FL=1
MFARKLRKKLATLEEVNNANHAEKIHQKALVKSLEAALRDAVLMIKGHSLDDPMRFFDGGECEELEEQLLHRNKLKRGFDGRIEHRNGYVVFRTSESWALYWCEHGPDGPIITKPVLPEDYYGPNV